MSLFSEESLLVVKNWETVEEINKAAEQLRSDLNKLLRSFQSELVKLDWWSDDWETVESALSQVYISNKRWEDPGSGAYYYAIWIGVERFSPQNIFGQESPPMLYVWVANRRSDLAQRLVKEIVERDWGVYGETDTRATGYVVRDYVKKCLPEEVETYDQIVRPQIVEFLDHYANCLMELDPIIQKYLQT